MNTLLIRTCWSLIAIGVVLRVHDLSFPLWITFDEYHFVENARNFIQHKPDWNDHPPLGKFLIWFGIEYPIVAKN